MTIFSGGKEIINRPAESVAAGVPAADTEITTDRAEVERVSDQPSWPRRVVAACVESARQSSAYADQVGTLALSGDIGGAIKAAIGLR